MIIPQGLVDVILSENISLEQKLEAIPKFGLPILHIDGPLSGQFEEAPLAQEDAQLIAKAVKNGHYSVDQVNGNPQINFYFSKEDLIT